MFFNRTQTIITRRNLKLITKPRFNQTIHKPNHQFKRNFTNTNQTCSNQSIFSIINESYEIIIQKSSILFLSQPINNFTTSYLIQTILITLSVRSLITLPISIWSRNRIKRFEKNLIPEFKEFKSFIAKNARRKFRNDQEIGIYQNSLKKLFKNEFNRLQIQYKCKPLITILGSISIHIPIIFLMSNILRRSCEIVSSNPTHLLVLEKSPILGNSLILDDLGLSLITWMVFLINLEFNWALKLTKKKKKEIDEKENKELSFLGKGLKFWNPERIRNTGFLTGVFMMGYASFQPALVLVYWLTSNSFSIIQSLCFDLIDKRKLKIENQLKMMKKIENQFNLKTNDLKTKKRFN